jgi:hypothetical protein
MPRSILARFPARPVTHETGGDDEGGHASDRLPAEPWKRGPVLAVLALILTLVMLLHAELPDWHWNLGSLVETFLPWCGCTFSAGPSATSPGRADS